jgi:hypothetical protein
MKVLIYFKRDGVASDRQEKLTVIEEQRLDFVY